MIIVNGNNYLGNMDTYHINNIASACNGEWLQMVNNIAPIEHLVIDTRKIVFANTSLFFALHTNKNDGHNYIKTAYEAGIRNFVVSTAIDVKPLVHANIIKVADTLKALQQLATLHRSQFVLPVTAITGSNGKTIIKDWLFQLLRFQLTICKSPKSYNSQVGVPLSIWQLNAQHELALFEAGISERNEMELLANIIHPTLGIFNNLGNAHSEGFTDETEKLKEKLLLFQHVKNLVFSCNQTAINSHLFEFVKQHHIKAFSWSSSKQAEAYYQFTTDTVGKHTQIVCEAKNITVQIPFTDEASIWNACTCLAYLLMLDELKLFALDLPSVLNKFSELQAVEMRLQLKEANNNCIVINDSYNNDLDSLKIALHFLQYQGNGLQKTLILSDIYQSGFANETLCKLVAELIKANSITKFIAIGDVFYQYQHLFPNQSLFYVTTQQFMESFSTLNFENEIILLKGARQFEFEKINALLEKRVHETVFEINLNALTNNFNAYRKLLGNKVKIMAMVKAFSYGTGSYEIAKTLVFNQVDYLAVAYADEGVVLRKAGINTPIMVMNPEKSSMDLLLKYNLEPAIYNVAILQELINAANGQEVGLHIELDSGMKRLGFDANQIAGLLLILSNNKNIQVKSVMSHLAASEAAEHDTFTLQQIDKFDTLSKQIVDHFPYAILRHCLNSAGIVRFKKAQFDMVRLGVGLYGIDPAFEIQNQLQQIGTLKTVISQIRHIEPSESIGYGRKGVVTKPSRIAIVAIGYADGLDRKLSNGVGYMLVNNKQAPIIGNICMDMTMIDVTEIDCQEGDEAIVFGANPTITQVAEKLQTIPYEILTSISQRVKRVYYAE